MRDVDDTEIADPDARPDAPAGADPSAERSRFRRYLDRFSPTGLVLGLAFYCISSTWSERPTNVTPGHRRSPRWSTTQGHGYQYRPEYADALAVLWAPEGWSDADTERLKATVGERLADGGS